MNEIQIKQFDESDDFKDNIKLSKGMKLTETNIRKFCYKKNHARDFMRTGEHGLTLCVTKEGSCFFRLRYKMHGKKNWYSIGEYPSISLARANSITIDLIQMVTNGIDLNHQAKIEKDTAKSVNDIIEEFLPLVLAKRKSGNSVRAATYTFNIIKKAIGHIDIKKLTREDIENRLILTNKDKVAQAKNIYSYLKRLLSHAVDQDYIEIDPTKKLKNRILEIPNNKRDIFLTRNELGQAFRSLYQEVTIPEEYKIALHLLLMLMVRKMDILTNKWSNIDFERKEMFIANTKNGTNLIVPLPWQAIKLLEILKKYDHADGYIFKGKIAGTHLAHNTLWCHWAKIKSKKINDKNIINNKDIKLHDFRHTSSTLLHSEGFRPEVIESALNHVKQSMWGRYNQHEYLPERVKLLQHFADMIDTEVGPKFLPY